MARTLPPIAELAEQIAHEVGGTAHMLWSGDYPSAGILLGDRHSLLLRDHGRTLTLSLPIGKSWALALENDWQKIVPDVRAAIASSPHPIAIADAVLAIAPVLERITGKAWLVSFPGTPVPAEAWFRQESRSVGLFQEESAVRIVIWIDTDMRSQTVREPSKLADLASWLETYVARQKVALDAAEAEAKRIAALPLPELEHVLSALKMGIRIRIGGGRWSQTYFWQDDALQCDVFDEGDSYVRSATREQLRDSIKYDPQAFRDALRM